jgi:glycosyltransferase involved in cell wall biosynthesis
MLLYGNHQQDEYFKKIYEDIEKDESIHYERVLTNEEVVDLMAKTDLMIYPNSFPETFCNAVNEALFVGCPVITTKSGNLQALVGEGVNGFLIEGDPLSKEYAEKFVEKVVEITKNKQLYKDLKQNAICNHAGALLWKNIAYLFIKKIEGMHKNV